MSQPETKITRHLLCDSCAEEMRDACAWTNIDFTREPARRGIDGIMQNDPRDNSQRYCDSCKTRGAAWYKTTEDAPRLETIAIDYLKLGEFDLPHFFATDEDKARALNALEMDWRAGENALQAWIRNIAARNGIAWNKENGPCKEIGEAIQFDRAISQFVFWLA